MVPQIAYPGLILGPASKYTPGPGTHAYESQIYASLAGSVVTTSADPQPISQKSPSNKPQSSTLPQLSVTRPPPPLSIPSHLVSATNVLPAVNDIVLAKVTRLQTRQVTVAILVVGETVCADSFVGVVRREDVRGWEIDRVVVGEGFRVGDVIRAVVVSSFPSLWGPLAVVTCSFTLPVWYDLCPWLDTARCNPSSCSISVDSPFHPIRTAATSPLYSHVLMTDKNICGYHTDFPWRPVLILPQHCSQ